MKEFDDDEAASAERDLSSRLSHSLESGAHTDSCTNNTIFYTTYMLWSRTSITLLLLIVVEQFLRDGTQRDDGFIRITSLNWYLFIICIPAANALPFTHQTLLRTLQYFQ